MNQFIGQEMMYHMTKQSIYESNKCDFAVSKISEKNIKINY